MQKKVQNSLLAVNIGVLALFMAGVAVILSTEQPLLTEEATLRADTLRVEPEPAEEPVSLVRVRVQAPEGEVAAPESGKCGKEKSKDCAERSLMVPIVFAFLAGGLINLPEVSSLPCI